ncbi:uncharacterized protein LODBEIA_P40530 [Lodderomyces beijingensis]|uniref:Uncharacterized protein n=1 Tax=Lodderomyces beijingensis TaxID=1775926 RepID=A0ABP0ZPI3_9ASCO
MSSESANNSPFTPAGPQSATSDESDKSVDGFKHFFQLAKQKMKKFSKPSTATTKNIPAGGFDWDEVENNNHNNSFNNNKPIPHEQELVLNKGDQNIGSSTGVSQADPYYALTYQPR